MKKQNLDLVKKLIEKLICFQDQKEKKKEISKLKEKKKLPFILKQKTKKKNKTNFKYTEMQIKKMQNQIPNWTKLNNKVIK